MSCEPNHIIGFRTRTSRIMRMSEAPVYEANNDFIPFKYCPECGRMLRKFVHTLIDEEPLQDIPKMDK